MRGSLAADQLGFGVRFRFEFRPIFILSTLAVNQLELGVGLGLQLGLEQN